MRIKVGDTVEIVKTKYGGYNDKYVGRVGEVEMINENIDGTEYVVSTDPYQPDYCFATEVKLVGV